MEVKWGELRPQISCFEEENLLLPHRAEKKHINTIYPRDPANASESHNKAGGQTEKDFLIYFLLFTIISFIAPLTSCSVNVSEYNKGALLTCLKTVCLAE